MGEVVDFRGRAREQPPLDSVSSSDLQDRLRGLAEALGERAQPRMRIALEHLETALALASSVGEKLQPGAGRDLYQLQLDGIRKNISRLRYCITEL